MLDTIQHTILFYENSPWQGVVLWPKAEHSYCYLTLFICLCIIRLHNKSIKQQGILYKVIKVLTQHVDTIGHHTKNTRLSRDRIRTETKGHCRECEKQIKKHITTLEALGIRDKWVSVGIHRWLELHLLHR